MRRANVLGLVWPMLQLAVDAGQVVGGTLTLPGIVTKNRRPLTMPLTGRLLAVVARRWQARCATCAHVFHRAGRPVRGFLARGRLPPPRSASPASCSTISAAVAPARCCGPAYPRTW